MIEGLVIKTIDMGLVDRRHGGLLGSFLDILARSPAWMRSANACVPAKLLNADIDLPGIFVASGLLM
jgi:hypothetical protein